MAKKTFTERNVYGGMSDDDTLVSDAQVLYSENLDLTTSSNFYTISQEPRIKQVTTDNVEYIFDAQGYTMFCDNDKNLYRTGSSTPVWTEEKIIASWVTSQYLYMLDASEDIHRILLTDLGQADWTSYITRTDNSISNTGADPFIISEEDITYVGIGNNIYRVLNSTGVVESANTFTLESKIVGLGLTEGRVEIFTEYGNYIIRDGVAGSNPRAKYLGTKIGLVKNIGNRNYIISGGAIYVLNGYTLDQISFDTYSDILNETKFSIDSVSSSLLDYQEGLFYLGVQGSVNLKTPLGEFEFGDDGILTMGQKRAGLPNARNIFLTRLPDGRKIKNIDSIYVRSQPQNTSGKDLYFGYEDDLGVFGVASIGLGDGMGDRVGKNGIMVYKSFDGGIKEQQKEMLNIKIRADFNNTDSKVYLCSIDTDGELQWINGTKEDSFVDRVGPDGFATFTFDSFNFHSFIPALILEQDGNYSRKNALKVYSLSYEYEDNIRRG